MRSVCLCHFTPSSECPHTLLSHHALCSPHSALASLSSARSAPSRSQLHLLHPPSSQFCAIPVSRLRRLSSFPNPAWLPSAQVSSPSSSRAAALSSSAGTSGALSPLSLRRCHSPQQGTAAASQCHYLPSQDALSRVER